MSQLALPLVGALALAFALLGAPVRAEHGSPLLLVKPGDGSVIPRNAQIRLVSYNGEDELIWLLGRAPRKISARLESDDTSIRLRPRRYFTDHDGYGRAMISLVPARLLEPQTEYRLVVEVPGESWRETLATFVTSKQIDRVAPRWLDGPTLDPADRTFVGRLAERDQLIEVALTARPRSGGPPRRTFVLFDLAQRCIEGPTADYNVAIYNSQCLPDDERSRADAICDTLYYFHNWRGEGTRYEVSVTVRDLAGNLHRARRPAGDLDLDAPFGVCLVRETDSDPD